MTSIEVRELVKTEQALLAQENFPLGTFVLDAGMVIHGIEKQGLQSHLTTGVPTAAQANALAADIKMIAPVHNLGMPHIIDFSQQSLIAASSEQLESYASSDKSVESLVLCGVNKAIEHNASTKDSVLQLLATRTKVIGISIEDENAKPKSGDTLEWFHHWREFEARINPSTAFHILAEYFKGAEVRHMLKELNQNRKLTWPNVIEIANTQLQILDKAA